MGCITAKSSASELALELGLLHLPEWVGALSSDWTESLLLLLLRKAHGCLLWDLHYRLLKAHLLELSLLRILLYLGLTHRLLIISNRREEIN